MFIQIQEQVTQLTEHIRDLILQGPDLTAFYILEARLTLLASYLRPAPFLAPISPSPSFSTLFQQIPLLDQPKNLQKAASASQGTHLSQNECFKLSFVRANNSNPVEDLLGIIQQISQTLQEWEVIMGKVELLKSKLQANKGKILIDEQLSLREQQNFQKSNEMINLKAQVTDSSLSVLGNEATCESQSIEKNYSIKETGKYTNQRNVECEVVSFMAQFKMWSRQLLNEITDFKAILETTKQDTSIDLECQVFFFSLEPPKQQSKMQGKFNYLCQSPRKKMQRRGSQNGLLGRRGLLAGLKFQRFKVKPKEKLPEPIRQSCASCQVF